MSRSFVRFASTLVVAILPLIGASSAGAQGVTTGAVAGRVNDATAAGRPDVRIVAVHVPSGTTYEARTRADGRFTLPGMRVGGPYRVTASAIGFEADVREDVWVNLGQTTDLAFTMREAAVQLGAVTVTAEGETVFSSARTGAATSVNREAIKALPTISGRIEDFARLTPQYSGTGFGFSFAGQDNRLNNVTVDGSYFNNSFGLAGQPGDRTGVAPISMDAIEQLQINIAPYDVRQGNFVGAGVNTVTRSGTNQVQGSLYWAFRDNRKSLHGTKAGDLTVNPGEFNFKKVGLSVGGPIIPNRLFFFTNLEYDGLTSPGTNFRANTGGQPVEGNTTRVLESDLVTLSNYLRSNFGYETGPFQDYDHETPAMRFLAKFDFNANDRNKLSLRFNVLESDTDVLLSNSSSLGFGSRRSSTLGLNFQNSNYKILENIKSVVGEWNSTFSNDLSNNMIFGYTSNDESRGYRGEIFPMVDILNSGTTYTTFGFEPFTPNNELRYSSLQFLNNITKHGVKHELTAGVSAEWYESENVFFSGSQSVYVYNSLADFYTDANGYLANPNRTTSPVALNRFQVRYMNQPGLEKPVQPLEVFYAGIYGQDQWRVNDRLRLTMGLRFDAPRFGETGFENDRVPNMNFRDENGRSVKFRTDKLPGTNVLISPRLGFNLDVTGTRSTQIRGGTGIFTGRPAYVWISNQIGENGVLTGFERLDNTTARPFNPNPNRYKPASVSGAPAATYALAFTDSNYKFPQLWRTNVALDQRLPWGLVGTGEFLYSKDVNGVYYINANLPANDSRFVGADNRERWTVDACPALSGTQIRVNCPVTDAIVLKNQNDGYSWNLAGSLEKPFGAGTFLKTAYSYGVAKNTVDPGSIAFGSWNNNQHSGNPNKPGLAYAGTSPGHRFFVAGSIRRQLFNFGATTASLFLENRTIGNTSYTFSGDLNGDGGTSNDLIYIPRDVSEMNFEQYTQAAIVGTGTTANPQFPAVTFTIAEQQAAWEAFILQDDYLSANRGKYAERNAVFLPRVTRADFSLSQEVFGNIAGQRNALSLRLDFLNVGNLINKNWGLGQRIITTQPLVARGADAQGRALYRLQNVNRQLITKTLEQTAGTGDVYRIQLGVRYSFN
ncbi:MAG TPA: carboxypeptidase regulatory-like domain-containing protein [Gemmatimonadaceae bacterium]|nr:carboxypeptidase regulatory-like domain-containing protein [Gemmatimonadaceae bacterium]